MLPAELLLETARLLSQHLLSLLLEELLLVTGSPTAADRTCLSYLFGSVRDACESQHQNVSELLRLRAGTTNSAAGRGGYGAAIHETTSVESGEENLPKLFEIFCDAIALLEDTEVDFEAVRATVAEGLKGS